MAAINYLREWKRIINQLQNTAARLNIRLTSAETDEERTEIRKHLADVQQQLERANEWIKKHTARTSQPT